MAKGKIGSWAYCEEFIDESSLFDGNKVVELARERGSERGVSPVLAGAAAQVRTTAALLGARNVIEVGTGSGVLSLYLASVMGPDATLTTIDPEPENVRAAREAFASAEITGARIRTINGHGVDVFPRLTHEAYDMVVLQADHPDVKLLAEQSLHVLRKGGALIIVNVLFHDRVADSAHRDAITIRIRSLLDSFHSNEELIVSLSPAGDGVLTAIVR